MDHITVSKFRLATSPLRAKPDYLLIGTQKGGTTRAYRYLINNPLILPCLDKEARFFSRDDWYAKGLKWYKALYPFAFEKWLTLPRYRKKAITGEATPSYLLDPETPERVKNFAPHVKLIAMLREPASRAWSQYQMAQRDGFEPETDFWKAVENSTFDGHAYIERGYYAQQLERWFEHFDRDRFLIMRSEDFFEDEQAALDRIYKHLDIPNFKQDYNPEFKPAKNDKKKDPFPADIRKKLQELYKPHNEELFKLLGERWDWGY